MGHFGKIIEFSSSRFPYCEKDEELVNFDSMRGYALARYIADGLSAHGFKISDEIGEDWGWLFEIENDGYALWYGVSSDERSDDFIIQFHPDKPMIRKWFKKIDVSERLGKLQNAVFALLQGVEGATGPKWVG